MIMDTCKIQIQEEINKVRNTLVSLESDLNACKNSPVDDIIDLLCEYSHVERTNIFLLDQVTDSYICLDINESSFSGDGSLDGIYKKTGFHVTQCHNNLNRILLRFEK